MTLRLADWLPLSPYQLASTLAPLSAAVGLLCLVPSPGGRRRPAWAWPGLAGTFSSLHPRARAHIHTQSPPRTSLSRSFARSLTLSHFLVLVLVCVPLCVCVCVCVCVASQHSASSCTLHSASAPVLAAPTERYLLQSACTLSLSLPLSLSLSPGEADTLFTNGDKLHAKELVRVLKDAGQALCPALTKMTSQRIVFD